MFPTRKRMQKRTSILAVEQLEERCLPSWAPLGPEPQRQDVGGVTVGLSAPQGQRELCVIQAI